MITEEQIAKARDFFSKQKEIIAVYLYGSFVRGTNNALSDIDIAIMLENSEKTVNRRHLDFIGAMMDIFKTDNVDIQILTEQTAPTLALSMIKGKVIYYRDNQKRTALEARLLSRYQDFLPFLKYQIKYMEERLKKGSYAHRY